MNKFTFLFAFFLMHVDMAFFIYPESVLGSTRTGHWEPVLVGYLLEALFIWVYLKGLSSFPKKDLVDIFNNVVGKWLARIFLFPFVLYLLIYLTIIPRHHSEMLVLTFLPKVPIWAVLMLLLMIPLYSALKGIRIIFRASILLILLTMPIFLFSLANTFTSWDFHYALPIFNAKLTFLHRQEFYASLVSFSSFLILGMNPSDVSPVLKKWRYLFFTYAGLLPFYLLSVYIPVLIFGENAAAKLQFPTVAVVDTVDIPWLIFDRLTMVYVFTTLASSFLYASIVLWMATRLIQRLYLPLKSSWIAVSIAFAVFFSGWLIPNWVWVWRLYGYISFLSLYCMAVIPLTVLIMGLMKRRRMV